MPEELGEAMRPASRDHEHGADVHPGRITIPQEQRAMITEDFIVQFREATETRWRNALIDPDLYGFQIQPGTRWNPGLSNTRIAQYENDLGFAFSSELRLFLAHLNGTDKPTLNIYGNCGEPHRTGPGVYAYPMDLAHVRQRMTYVTEDWPDLGSLLAETGLARKPANLLPFYRHRYVVCGAEFPEAPVLSIHATDAILYGQDFREYLEREFLRDD